jgi:hypothetical protein
MQIKSQRSSWKVKKLESFRLSYLDFGSVSAEFFKLSFITIC